MAQRNGNQAKRKGGTGQAAGRNLRANAGRAPQATAPALLDASINRDIAGLVLAVVAIASLIAVMAPATAPVTRAIAGFYHLGFGLGGYLLPFVLLGVAALVFARDHVGVQLRTAAGSAVIFVAVIALLVVAMTPESMVLGVTVSETDLARSGGYVGYAVASVLCGAFGKPIAAVLLVGLIGVGAVLIGFSITGTVQGLRDRVEDLAARRRIPVNDRPWGDDPAAFAGGFEDDDSGEEPAPRRHAASSASRRAGKKHASTSFDTAETKLVDQLPTTLLDDLDDEDDDPFVDVSDQLAAERAETTLLDRGAAGVNPVIASVGGTSKTATPARKHSRKNQGASQVAAARADMAAAGTTDDADDTPPWLVEDAEAERSGAGSTSTVSDVENVDANATTSLIASATSPSATLDTASDGGASGVAIPSFLLNPKLSGGAETSDATTGAATTAEESPRMASTPARTVNAATATTETGDEGERQLPPLSMLRHNPHSASSASSDKELAQTAESLQSTLAEFNLHSRVVGWISGPTVTTFKVQPGEGERVSRISSLEDDIALSLAAQSVRIFAPIPGTSLVGIEIPNRKRQNVNLGDVLPYVKGGPLELAIGRDAEGAPIVADLAKMPHLLIAGTTGSGKSVMINSIVVTLLMRTVPEDVRLIMVDPKRVELAGYNGLPHLYVPVVTEPKQAASALQWGVSEMERRLKVFERLGVRNIATFNAKQQQGDFEHYDNPPAKMPYLVIIIDELSDLMMVAGKDVEASIVRIAQLGRAAGIHLIVATQRPSSNVVTGLIKANITNRIAFNVATGIDSRVIIDQMGAEKLTGLGDMLFSKVDWGKPKRIQGCFVSDDEINQVVEFVKSQGEAEYHEEILSAVAPAMMSSGGAREATDDDPLIWEAARIVVESQLGSTSGLQRRLKVGYARAGRIMDMLEEKGVVGPPDGSKPREVLLDEEGLAELESLEARMAEDDELGGL